MLPSLFMFRRICSILSFSTLFSLWTQTRFQSRWRCLISKRKPDMTSLFFIIIFQHFLTVVHYCATRKWTRPMNVPWYWTSVINIKYFLFVPASSFPNNPQAGFRSQNIPGTILKKQFACHLLVLEIKRVY